MALAGILSPSTANLMIGKAIILLKPVGVSAFYHVGNVPQCEITPSVETLEHFSSMEGTKTKDEVIVITQSGSIKMTMEEITANNLALLMLGEATFDGYGGATVDLFSQTSLTSAFRCYGTNNKGPRWFWDLPKVVWNPSGAFNPISDEYANMEATGEWAAQDGNFGTATLLTPAGTAAPTNVLAPEIAGDVRMGGELEAFIGGWIGSSGYTYQWKKAAVVIPDETNKTYTTVVGDIASSITCTVTATNTVGSTSVTTAGVTILT